MKARVLKPIIPFNYSIGQIIPDTDIVWGPAQTKYFAEQGYIEQMPLSVDDVADLHDEIASRPTNDQTIRMIERRMPTVTKGDQGEAGVPGIKGDTGQQGITGPQGPIGLTGPPGPKGDIGPVGPQGIQGAKGDIGSTGLQGPKGDTGAAGPQGATGLTGAAGLSALTATVSQALPLIALGGVYSFTVAVTGATTNMCALVNLPSTLRTSLNFYSANIDTAGQVTVTLVAGLAIAAGNKTFVIKVIP